MRAHAHVARADRGPTALGLRPVPAPPHGSPAYGARLKSPAQQQGPGQGLEPGGIRALKGS